MTLVDTSVWISYFRGKEPKVIAGLHQLLDNDEVAIALPIRLEILCGVVRQQDVRRVRGLLDALPTFFPDESIWKTAEAWAVAGAQKGQSFGVADLVIAATADASGTTLWSKDSDFERMAALGWVKTYANAADD